MSTLWSVAGAVNHQTTAASQPCYNAEEIDEITVTAENDPKEINDMKAVPGYTDIPIDAAGYSRIINAHLMEEGNNYYIYNR